MILHPLRAYACDWRRQRLSFYSAKPPFEWSSLEPVLYTWTWWPYRAGWRMCRRAGSSGAAVLSPRTRWLSKWWKRNRTLRNSSTGTPTPARSPARKTDIQKREDKDKRERNLCLFFWRSRFFFLDFGRSFMISTVLRFRLRLGRVRHACRHPGRSPRGACSCRLSSPVIVDPDERRRHRAGL